MKKILTDILGVLLIISAGLFGWLPGPGGIPLFFAGLGLLAANHEWARKLLNYFKTKGVEVSDIIFNDHPVVKIAYDIVSTGLVVLAVYLIATYTRNLTLTLGIISLFTGLTIFFGNRKRLDKLTKKIKQIRK